VSGKIPEPELSARESKPTVDSCPHCGELLSPWQQVLLAVDRALVCRKCWYRILVVESEGAGERDSEKPPPSEG
jgi:DNA-directed RNA polymerase subunit RPC12/RpoP